ncbi:MAG: endolytic transglycosylase MltG [Microcoleaceae cyanobacterium]
MGQLTKRLFYLAILPVIWAIAGWQGWSWWSWVSSAPVASSASLNPSSRPSANAPAKDDAVQITIPSGTSSQQIGQDLEAAGLIRSANAWRLWSRWLMFQDPEGEFKAGTYQMVPTQPLSAIAEKVWKGEVMQSSFTIPEGWSIQQMAEYFEQQGFFTAEEFVAAASRVPADQFPWLPQKLPQLEGFLYPDTYQVESEQITPEGVVNQMLKRFEEVALPVYQQAQDKHNLDLKEWVTLASIVEKESVVDEERGVISGVFHNRLKQGINLAADPTVEYGLGIRQTVEQPLTFKQVKTPSPYNTYLNPGLPPTAIASPGVASLEATLNPKDTEFLYFMARYDGTHIFSKTEAEHQAAIAEVERQLSTQ